MKVSTTTLSRELIARLSLLAGVTAYTLPVLLAGPQMLVGTVINGLIFTAAEKMENKYLYPMLMLPSLGALTRGILFGKFTIFLAYFLPFIWLGNYVQVIVFNKVKGLSYSLRVLLAGLMKYLILMTAARIYFQLHLVPKMFITSMGLVQLMTASLGGVLAYFLIKAIDNNE